MSTSFQPRYLFPTELATFGLPSVAQQPDIMNLVEMGSTLIDEVCGRTDGNGNGSLVYTTYVERLLPPVGRNIVRATFKPLVAVTAAMKASLQSLTSISGDNFDTGVLVNNFVDAATLAVSPLLACSGRYGYGRRGQFLDLHFFANPMLTIASLFGGPPTFTPIAVEQVDINPLTGELWVPAGIQMGQYSEIFVVYNSGYDPLNMPRPIKFACACLVKNFMARGGGTTGLRGLSVGKISTTFTEDLVDPTVEKMLRPFMTVQAV